MTETSLIAAVVADQRDSLIRAEVRAGEQRQTLEDAVVQAIRHYGISVEDMSEASGLRIAEIRNLLA